jgi:phenylalanyl-tRNA synthetase beta subunit
VRPDANEFMLFEINPVHAKGFEDKEGLPLEDERLAAVFAADDKTVSRKYAGAPYYQAAYYLQILLSMLGIKYYLEPANDHDPTHPISQAAIAPFQKERAALVKAMDGNFLGELGEFTARTRQNFKLPSFTAGFELDTSQLMQAASTLSTYQALPRFPKVVQDITLKVPSNIMFGQIETYLLEKLDMHKPQETVVTLGFPRIYQPDDENAYKHFTWRIWLSHFQRTLTASEVNKLLDQVAEEANKLGVVRV